MNLLAGKKISHKKYMLTAFLLPLLIMVVVYISEGVYPVGGRGVALVDSFHQYVPFFGELNDKLTDGGSLLYSWNGGLGFNFTAVMAYYLMSPLNILMVLVPKSQILTLFSVFILIKVSLSSLSFYFYISKKLNRDGFSLVAFSLMYAMSSWTIGYNWNVMWLDSLAIFPVLIYALERLIDKDKGILYCLILGATIILNFYIAFAICIFLVLYFFYYYFGRDTVSGRDFIGKGFKFAGFSLLGEGISAVVIVPVYFALQHVYSSGREFPTDIKFYYNAGDLFTRALPFATPTKVTGLPNLYFGLFSLMAVILFVFLKKASLRRRVMSILLVAFLIFSTDFKILNYIWHGFHFPNDLPARFTFLVAFMGASLAAEVYLNIKEFKMWHIIFAYGLIMAAISLSYVFGTGKEDSFIYILSAALSSAYFMMLIYLNEPDTVREKLKRGLVTVMVLEVAANGAFGLAVNGTMNRDQYVKNIDVAQDIHNIIETMEGDEESTGFYRSEMDEFNGRNNSMWLSFRGMSLFSSTMREDLQLYLKELGFFSAANKFSYLGATPVTDALFSMKYLMAFKELPISRTFKKVRDVGDKVLLRNDDALSLCYMADDGYEEGVYEAKDPFALQNRIVTGITGSGGRVFEVYGPDRPTVEDGTLRTSDENTFTVDKDEDADTCTVRFTADLSDGEDHYIYFKATDFESLKVENENGSRTYSDVRGHIVELGNSGEASMELSLKPDKESGTITLVAASLNRDVYEKFINKTKENQLHVTKFSDTRIEGTITAEDSHVMLTSIPYDDGWSVYVDGERTEIHTADDAFIYVKLPKGTHKIEFSYEPEGLKTGAILTAASLVLLIFLYFLGKKLKIRRVQGDLQTAE